MQQKQNLAKRLSKLNRIESNLNRTCRTHITCCSKFSFANISSANLGSHSNLGPPENSHATSYLAPRDSSTLFSHVLPAMTAMSKKAAKAKRKENQGKSRHLQHQVAKQHIFRGTNPGRNRLCFPPKASSSTIWYNLGTYYHLLVYVRLSYLSSTFRLSDGQKSLKGRAHRALFLKSKLRGLPRGSWRILSLHLGCSTAPERPWTQDTRKQGVNMCIYNDYI